MLPEQRSRGRSAGVVTRRDASPAGAGLAPGPINRGQLNRAPPRLVGWQRRKSASPTAGPFAPMKTLAAMSRLGAQHQLLVNERDPRALRRADDVDDDRPAIDRGQNPFRRTRSSVRGRLLRNDRDLSRAEGTVPNGEIVQVSRQEPCGLGPLPEVQGRVP
jgi:hypothetical protein